MNKIINLFIIPICLFVIVSLCGCNHVENKINQINDVKSSASIRSVEMIISNIEVSYSNAILLNFGDYPTIKQVSEQFNMSNVTMNSNGDITTTDDNINCTTTIDNSIFKVICKVKDYEVSTTDMVINLENN